jgi:hypothetical protein
VILEGIVTTVAADGTLNIAPMGPHVDSAMRRFVLRPFRTSTTYRNLKERPEGVLHVTDDAFLLARTAIGMLPEAEVATRPAECVAGRILVDTCRYYEFRVVDWDDREERTTLLAETVAEGWVRDFFGFNRAKHAVVEAAILATRASFLPLEEVFADYQRLAPLVEKTGGPAEREAFALLSRHVREVARQRGFDPDTFPMHR